VVTKVVACVAAADRLRPLALRRYVVGGAALIALVLVGACAQAGTERAQLSVEPVFRGLSSPLYLISAPGQPNNVYIVEQPGRILVATKGKLRTTPFLDIHSSVVSGGEQGLLSVAFHPKYKTNHRFYVDYTDTNGDTRVIEYVSKGLVALKRRRQLLFVKQPYSNHNGGQLQFGPDGWLYVGMGDGGSGGDPENRAQNLNSRLGKLLRINVNTKRASVQIVGYGLRNPWRFSFDKPTGDLYIGDVGQNNWEEVDYTPHNSAGIENYGWNVYEGTHSFENKAPNSAGHLVMPVAEYSHSEGCSITGGYVYHGSAVSALRGRYIYGDYCSGRVWSLRIADGKATDVRREAFTVAELSSWGLDSRGELYAVSLSGTVYRVTG
jgi:glucose/arabinose dehydrogenase